MANTMAKLAAMTALALATGACAIGLKESAGSKAYAASDYATARTAIEAEIAKGELSGRYALGSMYLAGQGGPQDVLKGEHILTDAAVDGDPRAISVLRARWEAAPRCAQETELRNLWGSIGTAYRNLVTGDVELFNAPPRTLMDMAAIYLAPCPGAERREDIARRLDALARTPRRMMIYVPG